MFLSRAKFASDTYEEPLRQMLESRANHVAAALKRRCANVAPRPEHFFRLFFSDIVCALVAQCSDLELSDVVRAVAQHLYVCGCVGVGPSGSDQNMANRMIVGSSFRQVIGSLRPFSKCEGGETVARSLQRMIGFEKAISDRAIHLLLQRDATH